MATTADIQIKVGGLDKLQKFREQLWESNKILKKIKEDNLNTFNKLTGTIGELNRSLQIATENLQNVKRGYKAQKDEVVNYVTALGQLNKAQADLNRLVQNEINLREQQAAALKRVKDNSITALPSRKSPTFVEETISKGRSARIARERSAFLLGDPQAYPTPAGPLQGRGGTPGFPIALPLPAGQQKALEIQRQKLAIIERTKKTTQELVGVQSGLTKLAKAEAEARLEGARNAAQMRGELEAQLRQRGIPSSPNQYGAPIGPETAQRAGLKKGLSQFADFGLGAGFPLLFGGGAGQVAGGGIGTALGKSLGLESQAVFGLQIAFSAVGDQIEQAIRRIVEMQGAIESLDMDRLAKSTLYVDQNLRSAVNGLVKAGQYADAYASATETAAMQTGLIGSQQENIAGTVEYLGNAWNRLVTSGSAFLSIVGAPLAAALGGVVDLIGLSVKGWNMLLSGVGELITRIPGVKQGLDLIKEVTYQVTEEQAKQLAQAEQRTDSLRSQASLDNKLLELEKQRVAVVDSSIPGAQAIADLNNANVDLAQRNLEIDKELEKEQGKINEKYSFLVGLKGEALVRGESLKRQELALVQSTANRQKEEAKLNNERIKGQIALKEQTRLINEAISRLEYRFQLTQQTRQLELNEISNILKLAEARYSTEKQLLSNQIEQAKAADKIREVYKLKNALADLDYNIAVKRIRAEVRKLEIAEQLAITKRKQLQVSLALTVEGSKEEARLRRAVQLQREVVKQATANLSKGKQIAQEQIRQALAVREGAKEANKLAYEMERAAQNTERARNNAAGLKNELKGAADNASNLDSAMSSAGTSTVSVSTNMGKITRELKRQAQIRKTGLPGEYFEMSDLVSRFEREIKAVTITNEFGRVINKSMIAELRKGQGLAAARANELIQENLTRERVEAAIRGGERTIFGMDIGTAARKAGIKSYSTSTGKGGEVEYDFNYASGGYVSSPTNALVGEGGSEYVIPASKMAAAMERYAAGKRGNDVVPNGNDTQVNVSTGPVMQMNGQNYVTQSDFEKGLRSTVNQVMTTLRRSPNTRAAVGI